MRNSNLHSTMVLFKLLSLVPASSFFNIYIPLWSYSNVPSTTSFIDVMLFTFHYGPIQMLSYMNLNNISLEFTFHYGPIQIIIRFIMQLTQTNLHSTMVLFKFYWTYNLVYIKLPFTFHYGPIQIGKRDRSAVYESYLHSTMVLFKLHPLNSCAVGFFDLHSTMVLFK